jgi:hypothetical protein
MGLGRERDRSRVVAGRAYTDVSVRAPHANSLAQRRDALGRFTLSVSGDAAGLLRFEFSCVDRRTAPRFKMAWWGDQQSTLADDGVLIVPFGCLSSAAHARPGPRSAEDPGLPECQRRVQYQERGAG